MRETKTANRPAPWPQRLSAETLAPAVRRLLGTPTRGREGEQGAGQQRPARVEEVQQDSRKRPRRCGRPEGGRGAAALQRLGTGKRRRGVGRSRTRDAPRSQAQRRREPAKRKDITGQGGEGERGRRPEIQKRGRRCAAPRRPHVRASMASSSCAPPPACVLLPPTADGSTATRDPFSPLLPSPREQ
ncbi:hypothetical protein PVAP13_5NG307850 [Panicum virgatum]|uniref:Uncharacterized protein n=1 Tax=Panicum virgatum TaxID=38727 RepID=A0A8T0RVF5_PANVG|nr:hypothetical protein PVAP13_5NG307850 [Panicum virgatum]